ncbi:hypothetical protein [Brevundimonas sp.]|uniref:DUF6968 family protein n=1 Tax=Brevundimonas sp. TaxID=1871086 RepID=UPI001DBD35F7|nr:hypothetical protein [Brevundimonas sp.]MBA4000841.1 hypothetical protein [Brevundimonas sp.]
MSELVCDREFTGEIDGVERRIVVEWMKPHRERGDWRCDWVIHGLGDDPRQGHAFGVDSAQALLLAMGAVRGVVEHEAPKIRWLSADHGLGLPAIPEQ